MQRADALLSGPSLPPLLVRDHSCRRHNGLARYVRIINLTIVLANNISQHMRIDNTNGKPACLMQSITSITVN